MAWDSDIINLDDALARVLGRKELYKRWLDSFFEDENFTPVIKAYEKRNRDELRIALHKIKGAAGNLSVMAFFNQALLFSIKIKGNQDLDTLSNDLEVLREDFYVAKKMYNENIDYLLNYNVSGF